MEQGQARAASNGLGTAAMVVGIIALVLALIPGIGLISLILGPVALILGIIAVTKKDLPNGGAKAGIATGVLAILVSIAWLVYFGMRAAADRDQASESSSPSVSGTIGSAPSPAAASATTRESLIGEWSLDPGDCTGVFQLHADGTYTSRDGTRPGPSGRWTLAGDELSIVPDRGPATRQRVVEVANDRLLMETPEGQRLESDRCQTIF